MMKLRADNLIVFGLSEENVKRLKEGRPIFFDGAELVLPGMKFAIIYGTTEQQMEQDLINAGFRIPQ